MFPSNTPMQLLKFHRLRNSLENFFHSTSVHGTCRHRDNNLDEAVLGFTEIDCVCVHKNQYHLHKVHGHTFIFFMYRLLTLMMVEKEFLVTLAVNNLDMK